MGCFMNLLWLLLGGIFYGGGISYLKFINDDYYHRYSFGMQTLKLAGLALWPFWQGS